MAMNRAEKQVVAESLRNEATVIRQMRENYKEARANIEEKIKELVEREQTQSVIWQMKYQESLKEQLDSAIDILSRKNYTNIHQYLLNEYDNGFIGTMYNLQQQGIPMVMPIDQRQVARMVETTGDNIKLSKKLYGQTTKLKNAVRREVSIGLSSGESYQNIAGRLSRTMNIDYNKSVRIARTEGHRVNQASGLDAAMRAKDNGADIVKQWDATLDGRTRAEHRQRDGEVRELDEMFSGNGMAPGMYGRPWEDINCRCVMLKRARWAVEGEGFGDYTKYSRFKDMSEAEYQKWKSGADIAGELKHGGVLVNLSDSKNFAQFAQRYKAVADAATVGVSVMGGGASAEAVEGVYTMNRDAQIYQTLETEHVDKIAELLDNAPNKQVAQMYLKYEDDFRLVDKDFVKPRGRSGAHFDPKAGGVRLNISNVYKDERRGSMTTWFHEFGHNADYFVANGTDNYISYVYKDNLFGKTLVKEVDDLVSAKLKQNESMIKRAAKTLDTKDIMKLQEKGLLSETDFNYIFDLVTHVEDEKFFIERGFSARYAKSVEERKKLINEMLEDYTEKKTKKVAYKEIEDEINTLSDIKKHDISDIFEGASKGEIQAGWGHGKDYWTYDIEWHGTEHARLSMEAFAEMTSASIANPESLAIIEKYFPESLKVYNEMVEAILKGAI